jgi:hypothetical protein
MLAAAAEAAVVANQPRRRTNHHTAGARAAGCCPLGKRSDSNTSSLRLPASLLVNEYEQLEDRLTAAPTEIRGIRQRAEAPQAQRAPNVLLIARDKVYIQKQCFAKELDQGKTTRERMTKLSASLKYSKTPELCLGVAEEPNRASETQSQHSLARAY